MRSAVQYQDIISVRPPLQVFPSNMEVDINECESDLNVSGQTQNEGGKVCDQNGSYPPLPHYPPCNWKYEMRREMQEICPNVYFGSYASANSKKLEELESMGITHIVCVRHSMEHRVIKPNFPNNFIYKVVEMNENSIASIIPSCMTVCEFVSESLEKGGTILIHGNSGAGSSAILIIAFIMFRYGVSPKTAHQYVQQRRFCIRPVDSFIHQLSEFEPIFKAKHQSSQWNHLDSPGGGMKRSIDYAEEFHPTGFKRSSDSDDLELDSPYGSGMSVE